MTICVSCSCEKLYSVNKYHLCSSCGLVMKESGRNLVPTSDEGDTGEIIYVFKKMTEKYPELRLAGFGASNKPEDKRSFDELSIVLHSEPSGAHLPSTDSKVSSDSSTDKYKANESFWGRFIRNLLNLFSSIGKSGK